MLNQKHIEIIINDECLKNFVLICEIFFYYIVNCEWEAWTECGRFSEVCDPDATEAKTIQGQQSRKYKVEKGPGGKECLADETKTYNGQPAFFKADCFKNCPGNL